MTYLLAIDVGTLSARAGLFDRDGGLIAAHGSAFALMHPAENHVVYRMDEIWAAVTKAVCALIAGVPSAAGSICGIAVDATSSIYIETSGRRPLDGDADVICWMDHRAETEAREIEATGDRYLDYLGGTCSPEMYLPKILWLKRHRAENWARVRAVRSLADEIVRRMTGVDRPSICALSCKFPYLPNDDKPWRMALLEQLDLAELPGLGALAAPPAKVGDVQGRLTREAAEAFGIAPGAPVAVSLIDAEAGALGVLGRGFAAEMNTTVALIGGTSTNYMAFARDERRVPGVWGPFKDAVFPGYWMHEAGQSISGAALDAVLAQHPAGPAEASAAHHADTVRDVLALLDAEGPSFAMRRHIVPDWLGNRSPSGDGSVRALVAGIGLETGRRAFLEHYYATARALVLQSRQIISHLNDHDYAIARACLSGGHLKNPLLVRIYRDALGTELVLTDTREPVLLGTAMVASVAAGLHDDLFGALRAMAPPQSVQRADPIWARAHDAAYRTYLKLFAIRNEIEAADARAPSLFVSETSGVA